MTEKKNARFKVWTDTSTAVLTLKAGESRHHSFGGLTDEGYDVTHSQYSYDGKHLYLEQMRRASDCDGPLTQWREMVAELPDSGDWPKWETEKAGQRDVFAESMGY